MVIQKAKKGLNPSRPRPPLFVHLSLPPEPAVYKLGWPAGLFVVSEVLTLVLRPSLVLFLSTFPFFAFWLPPFWTTFSYSNYLTKP